jgi:hypothetical protein
MKSMPQAFRSRIPIGLCCWLVAAVFCFLPIESFGKPQAEQPVYLYQSPLTSEFFRVNGSVYDDLLAQWRNYLQKFGKNYKELSRSQLLAKPEPGVLVLGSALLLDEEERQAIKTFTRNGGSVLATWATGSRGATGEWKGYGFLEALFNVRISGQIGRDSESWFLTPFGDGPLTWPVPAGRRIFLGKTAENLLRVESEHVAAVMLDWERAKDFAGPTGAITFHEGDTYRAAYFAFPESATQFHPQDELIALYDGIMSWLRREPRIFKATWPHGHVAAHLIEMDTEDKFFSAPTFARDMEKAGLRGTFYCLTTEAQKHPGIVKDLLKRGHEIAYHADVHTGFKGLKPEVQNERIKNMISQMRNALGDKQFLGTGFRAPTESYDTTTEVLLRKHGMLHHAADPAASEDRLPFFSKSEADLTTEQALVVLPRTQHDDVSFKRLNFPLAKVEDSMLHDLDLIEKSGAFGLLSVHSQNYVEGGLMAKVMPKYLEQVARLKGRLWVARGDEIASWWRQKVRVTVKQLMQEQMHAFRVRVNAPGSVEGLTVFVTKPSRHAELAVGTRAEGAAKVTVRSIDPFRSAIVFGKLAPGEYEYQIRFRE